MSKRLMLKKSVKNLPRSPDDTTSTSIPIPTITTRKRRKCERVNYVPHRTPNYSNRETWTDTYANQIYDMYRITGLMIESKYPNVQIDWTDPKYHQAFNKLIYHCSSKYITPYS